ncbi:MAG: hypothetical protein HQK50_16415, partial [Oligoflexia bacterium]|nr:hypothetical protein [Oligoflexia bacterium]
MKKKCTSIWASTLFTLSFFAISISSLVMAEEYRFKYDPTCDPISSIANTENAQEKNVKIQSLVQKIHENSSHIQKNSDKAMPNEIMVTLSLPKNKLDSLKDHKLNKDNEPNNDNKLKNDHLLRQFININIDPYQNAEQRFVEFKYFSQKELDCHLTFLDRIKDNKKLHIEIFKQFLAQNAKAGSPKKTESMAQVDTPTSSKSPEAEIKSGQGSSIDDHLVAASSLSTPEALLASACSADPNEKVKGRMQRIIDVLETTSALNEFGLSYYPNKIASSTEMQITGAKFITAIQNAIRAIDLKKMKINYEEKMQKLDAKIQDKSTAKEKKLLTHHYNLLLAKHKAWTSSESVSKEEKSLVGGKLHDKVTPARNGDIPVVEGLQEKKDPENKQGNVSMGLKNSNAKKSSDSVHDTQGKANLEQEKF